ncbi:MAG: FHA domain-containing protein [Ktedonobacterales bacterium]
MMYAVGAHAPLSVAALGLSNGVLVAAAGVVVVLAILLVFVMVLRSNGAARRTASGLGYDAQQGPLGQPQAPVSQGPRSRGGYGADDGYGANDGYGYNDPYAAPAGGRPMNPAQARGGAQDAWGAGPAGGGMPGAMSGGQGAGWGAGANGVNGASDGPWGGANDGWGRQPGAAAGQPMGAPVGMNGQMGQMGQMPGPGSQPQWDMPAQNPAGGARGGSWGPQAGTNPGAPGWDQPDPNAGWGGPAANPASANAGWGGAAAAGQEWGAPAPVGAPPSMPNAGYGAPNAPSYGGAGGYGELDKTRVVRPAGGPQRMGVLVVRQGKEPGHVFELRKDRITIGRSRESDIFLEDLAVSRLHTTVSADGAGRYIVRDENSANGTFVNGQRISEHVLEEGDEVQVGQTMLAFQRR